MTEVLDDARLAAARLDPMLGRATLRKVVGFGSNPGNLAMRLLVPERAASARPIVAVLHGCGQTVEGYDAASGWSRLALAHDFMLLYPEQKRDNNRQGCFSWFEPADVGRTGGEVESIRQMIGAAVEGYGGDIGRIFICGLSAGGAMAGALLATYPDIFAGGAIIAGLPYGTASNVHEAYESMSSGRVKDAKVWGDLVRRAASAYAGPWPSVAIWHGMADGVVKPINAGELVKQWTNVHGLGATVPSEDHVGKTVRRVWRDETGRPCVTDYCVPGLAHGAPVDDRDPPAPFFLPAGISSTWHIANDWGLVEPATRPEKASPVRTVPPADKSRETRRDRLLRFLGL